MNFKINKFKMMKIIKIIQIKINLIKKQRNGFGLLTLKIIHQILLILIIMQIGILLKIIAYQLLLKNKEIVLGI